MVTDCESHIDTVTPRHAVTVLFKEDDMQAHQTEEFAQLPIDPLLASLEQVPVSFHRILQRMSCPCAAWAFNT